LYFYFELDLDPASERLCAHGAWCLTTLRCC